MRDKVKFVELVEKFKGKPYQLGGRGDPGYDCISLIYFFYKEWGRELPVEFREYNEKNYFILWEKDRNKARKLLREYFSQNFEKVDTMAQGDIVVIEKRNRIILGIYSHNGIILTSDPKVGVILIPLSFIEGKKEVYRWRMK